MYKCIKLRNEFGLSKIIMLQNAEQIMKAFKRVHRIFLGFHQRQVLSYLLWPRY